MDHLKFGKLKDDPQATSFVLGIFRKQPPHLLKEPSAILASQQPTALHPSFSRRRVAVEPPAFLAVDSPVDACCRCFAGVVAAYLPLPLLGAVEEDHRLFKVLHRRCSKLENMRVIRVLRILTSTISENTQKSHLNLSLFHRFYTSQPQQEFPTCSTEEEEDGTSSSSSSVFDSSEYMVGMELDGGSAGESLKTPTWDEKYRERVKMKVFGEESKGSRILEKNKEKKRNAALLAMSLLNAAVQGPGPDWEEHANEVREIKEEDQRSLAVGIIGAPNAGKSALTNFMVGTKVSAVSRKMNTTTHEVLGIMTKGCTQICFFDTPGLMLKTSGFPYNDIKVRLQSVWSSVGLFDVLVVIFDVHRHLTRPDSRVVRLIERMGSQVNPSQKRILCMNKIDLVEKKKDLLKVAEEFKDLPGYDKYFMISGLKGSGVKDLTQYLMDQAVERPWDEDPFTLTEEVMKNISIEVVREKMLDHVHQEIPYKIEHRLMDWKELRDGSLRIEQHFITTKMSQRKILVGKRGCKIGRIGVEANEELRSIFNRNVHLILNVRIKS